MYQQEYQKLRPQPTAVDHNIRRNTATVRSKNVKMVGFMDDVAIVTVGKHIEEVETAITPQSV